MEKGHWVIVNGRHFFMTDDSVEKRDQEIAEQEKVTKQLTAEKQPYDIPMTLGEHKLRDRDETGTTVNSITYTVNKDGSVYINYVYVHPKQRQQGVGTKMMNALLSEIDQNGRDVTLLADPESGIPIDKIVSWYKKLGFTDIKENEYGGFDMKRPIRK